MKASAGFRSRPFAGCVCEVVVVLPGLLQDPSRCAVRVVQGVQCEQLSNCHACVELKGSKDNLNRQDSVPRLYPLLQTQTAPPSLQLIDPDPRIMLQLYTLHLYPELPMKACNEICTPQPETLQTQSDLLSECPDWRRRVSNIVKRPCFDMICALAVITNSLSLEAVHAKLRRPLLASNGRFPATCHDEVQQCDSMSYLPPSQPIRR